MIFFLKFQNFIHLAGRKNQPPAAWYPHFLALGRKQWGKNSKISENGLKKAALRQMKEVGQI